MNRHALICGASEGIGQATAIALASAGHTVTLVARNRDKLDATAKFCLEAGAPAAYVLPADLDQRDDAQERIENHLAKHGPIHILINNTGGPPGGPLLAAVDSDIEGAIGRHVLMAHRLLKVCLPGMKDAGFGRVVNVLSTSVREPIPGLGVSNLTRAAMASWAKTMSRELPPGITINSILPGFTDTGRLVSLGATVAESRGTTPEEVRKGWIAVTPEGRLGKPEELGATIAFLCSDNGAFIRGVCLPVDGGRLNSI